MCKGDSKRQCRKNGIVYEIECEACTAKYIGETSRNGFSRCKKHAADYENKSDTSVLWRHCKEEHNSNKQSFKIKTRQCFGERDATLCQITKATFIKNEHPQINKKTEFNQSILPNAVIMRT